MIHVIPFCGLYFCSVMVPRCGKDLQKDVLKSRRSFWRKVKGKEEVQKWGLGIESEDGTLLTEQREVRNRWKDYLKALLEGEVRGSDMRSDKVGRGRSIVEKITEEEIKKKVWKLRSSEASGVCSIQGEVLKAGGEVIVKWLQEIYNMVWRTGEAPSDWRNAIIVPIHKKNS